jgi:hypothetical protein
MEMNNSHNMALKLKKTNNKKQCNMYTISFDEFFQKQQLHPENVRKVKGRPYKKPTKLIIISESDNVFSFYEQD